MTCDEHDRPGASDAIPGKEHANDASAPVHPEHAGNAPSARHPAGKRLSLVTGSRTERRRNVIIEITSRRAPEDDDPGPSAA